MPLPDASATRDRSRRIWYNVRRMRHLYDTLRPCRKEEEIKDEFMLSADGTVGVRKLNKQATRTTKGVIRLNGVLMR